MYAENRFSTAFEFEGKSGHVYIVDYIFRVEIQSDFLSFNPTYYDWAFYSNSGLGEG